MVERPIKKSERQAVSPDSNAGEDVQGKERPIAKRLDSSTGQSFQKKDRTKGRGKGNQEEARPSNINPALVRGKRPTKPKPPVLEQEPESTIETEEAIPETPQETTVED